MRRFRYGLAVCSLLAAMAAGRVRAQDPAPPEDLGPMLREALAEHHLPGAAAAVARSTGLVALGAAGRTAVEGGHPVTPRSRWHIGSCTKSMTAVLAAMMVEEGKLRFDATLAAAFPEAAETMHEDYRPVTLADLLHHRGGLPAFTRSMAPESRHSRGLEGPPADQRRAFAGRVLRAKPACPPRSKYLYSNGGYGIAAAIVERAAGKPWEELIGEKLFAPLGMTTAGVGWPASAERPGEPLGHWGDPDELEALPPGHSYRLESCLDPAGDVHCSIEDFARYAQMHLRGLRGEAGLLKPETFRLLHEDAGDYAMGWVVGERDGAQASRHDGSAGTFYASMTVIPVRDLAIVLATNAGTGEKAVRALLDRLLARWPAEAKGDPRPPEGGAEKLPVPRKVMALPADRIPESSGIVASRAHAGWIWTHNDSGGRAELIAVAPATGHVRAVPVPGAENEDWEDIDIDDQGRLLIGDIGDNGGARKDLRILRLPEPDPAPDPDGEARPPAPEIFRFRYPKEVGAADAEALVAAGGAAFVFTKEKGRARVFRVDLPERPPPAAVEAVLAGETRATSFVTGAALSADGTHLALLTYVKVTVIALARPWGEGSSAGATGTAEPFAGALRERSLLLGQAEGVAFDGADLLISTECIPGTRRGGALFLLGPVR